MSFASIFNTSGRPALQAMFGEAGRFRYRLNDSRTWTDIDKAQIGAEEQKEVESDDNTLRERVYGREVTVSTDADEGLPTGDISGEATVDDVEYAVIELVKTSSMVTFVLERREAIEYSRRNLRQRGGQ